MFSGLFSCMMNVNMRKNRKEKFDEAECILLETFNIAKTNGLNKKAAEIAILIGRYYIGVKREAEAARYLDEGVSIFRSLGILNN